MAANKPIKALWEMPTKPEPGVMATSPTTAPIQKPSTDGFLPLNTSKNIQDKPAAAAAVLVLAKRTLVDLPTIAIALTTAAILFRFKKIPEPYIIVAAALVGLMLTMLKSNH